MGDNCENVQLIRDELHFLNFKGHNKTSEIYIICPNNNNKQSGIICTNECVPMRKTQPHNKNSIKVFCFLFFFLVCFFVFAVKEHEGFVTQ